MQLIAAHHNDTFGTEANKITNIELVYWFIWCGYFVM
jgi:hypothetical protein